MRDGIGRARSFNPPLKPVVRIGHGVCSENLIGPFKDPAYYAKYVKDVMSAVGSGGDVWFIVGPNEPDVEQWASPGCDCSSSGDRPGGDGGDGDFTTPEPAPDCKAKQFSTSIKGTIKSSYDFAVVQDPTTNERKLISRFSIPQDQWTNYSFTNNQPVSGAIVAIYPSYAFKGTDRFGNTHENSPGKVGGLLRSVAAVNYKRVGPDGTFEITTSNTCDEVWQYGGWKQYLVVLCPEKVSGRVRTVVKDLYAFPLNKADAQVDMADINVACDADLTSYGKPSPPLSLEYVVRNPNEFLACSNTGEFPGADQPKGIREDIDLIHNDYKGDDNSDPGVFWWAERLKEWLKNLILESEAFHGVREGFIGVQGVSCDVNSMFSNPVGFYGGIKTDSVELAKYFTQGDPDTYNGYEQRLPLPLCAELKRCNQAVSFDGQNDNMQTCGGMVNNLRAPYDTSTVGENGNVIADEFGYAAKYRQASKDLLEICKDVDNPTATRYYLKDVAPPEGICGDTNLNKVLDNKQEMPCPENPNCGDLDDSGSIVAPEVACVGGGVTYKFDSRYFPYDALYTGTLEPLGSEFTTRQRTYNDSVSVAYAPGDPNTGRRIVPFGGTEGTQPDNVGTAVGDGIRFPAGFQSTKVPPGIYNSYGKVSQVSGSEDANTNPASLVLASPTSFNKSVSSNTIREALATLTGSIKFDAETEFYKIGTLNNLCTCSLMEDTSGVKNGTQVENCINNAKNVKIAQPLRNFTELTRS